jgi:hypothetical protein
MFCRSKERCHDLKRAADLASEILTRLYAVCP